MHVYWNLEWCPAIEAKAEYDSLVYNISSLIDFLKAKNATQYGTYGTGNESYFGVTWENQC